MKQWNYLQASFDPASSDKASGILWGLGTQGIEEDPSDSRQLRIKAYFDLKSDIQLLCQEFRAQCRRAGVRLFSCSLRIQPDRDWSKKWRQQLQPFTVGKRFQILPCHKPQFLLPKERLQLYLEPGMAFGTGTHETTQLCLEALERLVTPGSTCLDVGTGSGILAIAALKLGAKQVIACDTDPVALEIAKTNGARNRCGSGIRWVLGDVGHVRRFRPDVLVSNLTVELIEQDLPRFEQRLKPGSWLVVSGILSRQVSRLASQPRQSSVKLEVCRKKGEWACLMYQKAAQE